MPKKKTYYSSSKPKKKGPAASPEAEPDRPNLARINLSAASRQAGLSVGDKVRIEASGSYSGDMGTIERLISGVIPSALVRMAGGGSRQVRTVDLVAVPAAAPAAPAAEPAAVTAAEPAAVTAAEPAAVTAAEPNATD